MKNKLISCVSQEDAVHLKNPGRGYYHMFSFFANEEPDLELMKQNLWGDDTLVQLVFYIGAYKSVSIPQEALEHIDSAMTFFEDKGYDIILRFAYDNEGRGTEREPDSMGWILRHMEALGPLVKKHAENILVLQGLFIGSWGEMHGTHYDSPANLKELADNLRYETGGKVKLAVRKPCQWRAAFRKVGEAGMFDDGIFGSDTDLYTYAEEGLAAATSNDPERPWSRDRELEWQFTHLHGVPNGGEVLRAINTPGVDYKSAAAVLAKMRISYLNGAYQPEQLDVWRGENVAQGAFRGFSGYDYIGEHLGYRLIVRDIKQKRDKSLVLTIENTGFCDPCFDFDIYLKFTGDREQEIKAELKQPMLPGIHRLEISSKEADMLGMTCPGKLSVRMVRRRDQKPVIFANAGAGEALTIGEIKK